MNRRHRLKRDQLVELVLSLFSDRYDRLAAGSIFSLRLPVEQIRREIESAVGGDYTSDEWIITQLRRYERDIGMRMFRRVDALDSARSGVALMIDRRVNDFRLVHHLYRSQKQQIALGVVDLFDNIVSEEGTMTAVFLGSGSIPATVAETLLPYADTRERSVHIVTHNLAIQEQILRHGASGWVTATALGGTIDAERHVSFPNDLAPLKNLPIRFSVQSTNTVADGVVYVETRREADLKRRLIETLPGVRVLAIVKDEFSRDPAGLCSYGTLSNYDYIVTVPQQRERTRTADQYLARYHDRFERIVVHWNYQVYRVRRSTYR